MGSKTRMSSYCTKRTNNGVNLVTPRKINTRLARPITHVQRSHLGYELNAGTKLLIQSILKRMLNNVSEFDIPRGIENIDIFTIETRSGCLMLEGGGGGCCFL